MQAQRLIQLMVFWPKPAKAKAQMHDRLIFLTLFYNVTSKKYDQGCRSSLYPTRFTEWNWHDWSSGDCGRNNSGMLFSIYTMIMWTIKYRCRALQTSNIVMSFPHCNEIQCYFPWQSAVLLRAFPSGSLIDRHWCNKAPYVESIVLALPHMTNDDNNLA